MKVLITENVLVNYGDDRGGVDQAQGDIVDVPKETAVKLVTANRALYVDKKDDPSKAAVNTASAAMLKAAEAMVKARAAGGKAGEE